MSRSSSGIDFKAQVLSVSDIIEVIGQSVALKRRGKDYVGLCPFHQEKSPSFHVSPSKQFFHCYGCKAAGDVFTFIMKRDRVEFIDALKFLGQRAGLEMPKFGMSKEKSSEKQQLLDIHSAACSYFQQQLQHSEIGAQARKYLDERGFTADSITRFQIGVAPASWDSLLSTLGRKYPPQLLAIAGVVKPRTNGEGFYDTFRNRLMFPIRDESGRVIAFGGRVMPGSDDPAKYLNSPETPLFSKSRCIFGLDLARQRIVETRTVAVVEGYTDVVMAHQYGASNVVSILGTALTEPHLTILRRFADRVVLLFDADAAGDNAVTRAVELYLSQPVEIAVASIPEDLDPDEYLLKHGSERFDALLTGGRNVIEFLMTQRRRDLDAATGNITRQKEIDDRYLGIIATAKGSKQLDEDRWARIIAKIAKDAEISVDELNKRFKNKGVVKRAPVETEVREETQQITVPEPLTADNRAERQILGILLVAPELWPQVQEIVHPEQFTEANRRKLADIYWDYQRNEGQPVFSEFLGLLTEPQLVELAIELLEEAETVADVRPILVGALQYLQETRRRQEDRKQLAELRRTTDVPRPECDEVSLLRSLQESARQPDLRRA